MDLFKWIGWPIRRDDVPTVGDGQGTGTKESQQPRARYQGDFTPQNLAFDANLQEFAQRVAFICGLESAGKVTPNDAHAQIRDLYEELTRTHRGLGIGEDTEG